MPDRIRVALAGAGAFGHEHLQRLAAMPAVEIAGIADANPAAAQEAATQYGATQTDTDALALIGRANPDALIVATPGATHVPIATAALKHSIPVLVEKPVAMSLAEAQALAAAEAASSAFVLPGHVIRFSAHHRMLREIVQAPDFGPILGFASRRHRDDAHAVRYADVDPVLMTMIHDIDLGLWITGDGLVDAYALRRPEGTVRAATMMVGTGRSGVAWHLDAAWTFPGTATPPDRIEIVGANGSVEYEAGKCIRWFGTESGVIDLTAIPEDPLAAELGYFLNCVRTGKRPEAVTLRDACAGLAIAEAVLASIASGKLERIG